SGAWERAEFRRQSFAGMSVSDRAASQTGDLPEIPGATYRLQFNAQFGFCDGAAIVPYLHALGITHCYASPLFQAAPASGHGYDVCSFERLNPELGTAEDF